MMKSILTLFFVSCTCLLLAQSVTPYLEQDKATEVVGFKPTRSDKTICFYDKCPVNYDTVFCGGLNFHSVEEKGESYIGNAIRSSTVKKVLLEEFTTTRCGFCPVKSFDLEHFVENHPNAIGITDHAGFGTDNMTNPTVSAYSSAFYPMSAPSMAIDRNMYPGNSNVGFSMGGYAWEDSAYARLGIQAPVGVYISNNYDPSSREITGKVQVEFVNNVEPGDLRITLLVVEDSVTGDIGGNYAYDQKNYISNDPNYPELYQKPSPIEGYVHRMVVRESPLGIWGVDNVISHQPSVGDSFSTNFNYNLPVKYDTVMGHEVFPSRIHLVAFVNYHHADDDKRMILNAESSKLNGSTGNPGGGTGGTFIEEKDKVINRLYPNPAKDLVMLDLNLQANYVNIQVVDMIGRVVSQKNYSNLSGALTVPINTQHLESGRYFVIVKTDDTYETTSLIKK